MTVNATSVFEVTWVHLGHQYIIKQRIELKYLYRICPARKTSLSRSLSLSLSLSLPLSLFLSPSLSISPSLSVSLSHTFPSHEAWYLSFSLVHSFSICLYLSLSPSLSLGLSISTSHVINVHRAWLCCMHSCGFRWVALLVNLHVYWQCHRLLW